MQLDFLQKDLFSGTAEAATPTQQKKPRLAKSAPVSKAPSLFDPLESVLPVDLLSPVANAPTPKKAPKPVAAKVETTPAQALAPAPVVMAVPAAVAHQDQALAEDTAEDKAPGAFKTISEVAGLLGLPQHVLRFWESRFSQIKPLKMRGGRRYYRPDDIEILTTIKHLLYKQGYTIAGAKKAFNQGKTSLVESVRAEAATAPKISDKQRSQLSAIRQELFALRETLKPHLQA